MYTSFQIKNFRCFDNLKLDNLARVNLIAGKNNVGKSSVLEAIFIHSGLYNPGLALTVNALRGVSKMQIQLMQPSATPWSPIFRDFDTSLPIVIESVRNGKKQSTHIVEISNADELQQIVGVVQQESSGNGSSGISSTNDTVRVLRLEYKDSKQTRRAHSIMDYQNIRNEIVPLPPFQSVLLTARNRVSLEEEANRFTKMTVAGSKFLLLKALKILENRLTNLELLTYGGETMIHGDIGIGRPIPILFMGDGLVRLASIILAMADAPSGILLVDEIENGIHYSVLRDMWRAIAEGAQEFNVQIFATTHSLECIHAAHEAFSEAKKYDFRYHRLDRNENTDSISVETYDQSLMDAVVKADFEVRG